MYVDFEFTLKDDSRGIPTHIFGPLVSIYRWLRSYGFAYYYINYSGGGVFHFGYTDAHSSFEKDLHSMLDVGALGPWHWKAFLWLKRHTTYRGSSESYEGSAIHPDDFFKYVEDIIDRYEKEGSLCSLFVGSK